MKKKAMHYRHSAGVGICGIRLADGHVTRNRSKVTCGNCLKLMRLHGHEALPEDHDGPEVATPDPKWTKRLMLAHIKGLEAQVRSLTSSFDVFETIAEKWRTHAEAIQQLAAEGKDPLTGEEPEFWLVWKEYDRNPTYKHGYRQAAVMEAERLSCKYPGIKFYVLPALDYAICEISPVTWKRKSSEKALEADDEIPF